MGTYCRHMPDCSRLLFRLGLSIFRVRDWQFSRPSSLSERLSRSTSLYWDGYCLWGWGTIWFWCREHLSFPLILFSIYYIWIATILLIIYLSDPKYSSGFRSCTSNPKNTPSSTYPTLGSPSKSCTSYSNFTSLTSFSYIFFYCAIFTSIGK